MTEKEMLNYAIESGILDLGTIQKKIEMNERKKYLDMHKNKVWQSKNGQWNTYVDDLSSAEKRRRIKRSTRESIEDAIIEHYKNCSHDITIKELFYEWVEKKIEYGEIQKQTYDRYEVDFNRFFGDSNLLNSKVRYISEDDLEDFIRKTIHSFNLSSKAWGNLRTIINGMFKFARKRGYSNIKISVFMDELELSKRIFKKRDIDDFENIFTDQEIEKLIEYLENHKTMNDLAILIAIYTGMRVGEIVALKHEDIFQSYIYVRRTQVKYIGDDGKYISEIRNNPKTEAGVRKVAISEKLRPSLNELRKISLGNEFLFFDAKTEKVKTIHSIDAHLYRVCERIGIRKRSMHVLRKTYATRLINAGVDESVIINQMGHTEIETTKKYYYYNDKLIDQIADKINEAINF